MKKTRLPSPALLLATVKVASQFSGDGLQVHEVAETTSGALPENINFKSE